MYKIGDYIWYGKNGTCKVVDIYEPPRALKPGNYYKLEPVNAPRCKLSVPVGLDDAIMRYIMDKETATKLLASVSSITPYIMTDETARIERLQGGFIDGDHNAWIAFLKGIYAVKKQKEDIGKHLRPSEYDQVKKAQTLLAEEFTVAMGKPLDEVKKELVDALQVN